MPLLASDIQGADDPAVALAEKRERAIRNAIIAALLGITGLFTGQAIRSLIASYNARALNALINSDEAARALLASFQPIADTFDAAARQAANDNFKLLLVYDPLKSADQLTAIRQAYIDAIRDGEKSVIQAVMLDGLRQGASADAIAAQLRQVIGLNLQQATAVLNFRRLLTAGDSAALQRALRDKRYDAAVRRALAARTPLSAEQVDAMVGAYAERMLIHRAETIARTESMQAAVSGIRNAYVQAVASGQLFESEVRRYWLTAADERVCPVCSSVPLMNRGGRGVNEPYQSISGPIIAPLAHPRCRCSERYVADMTRLQEQPFRYAA